MPSCRPPVLSTAPGVVSSLLTCSECSSRSPLTCIISFLLYSGTFPLAIARCVCLIKEKRKPSLVPTRPAGYHPTSPSFYSKLLKSCPFLLLKCPLLPVYMHPCQPSRTSRLPKPLLDGASANPPWRNSSDLFCLPGPACGSDRADHALRPATLAPFGCQNTARTSFPLALSLLFLGFKSFFSPTS